jgi:hypothetical protein
VTLVPSTYTVTNLFSASWVKSAHNVEAFSAVEAEYNSHGSHPAKSCLVIS